jgi:hypothetical protein
MARRLIARLERSRHRGDVRARLRELQTIKDHAVNELSFFGR